MKKWEHNYIERLDLSKIEWLKLSSDELEAFYNRNYIDTDLWQYVSDEEAVFHRPIGLRYLPFDTLPQYSYLIGVAPNNIGKKTIIAATVYIDSYYMFINQCTPLTYISTMEVNSYFWNKGIFKMMCKKLLEFVDCTQPLLCTKESEMGELYHVASILKNIFLENGFEKGIFIDDGSYNTKLAIEDAVCNTAKCKTKTVN